MRAMLYHYYNYYDGFYRLHCYDLLFHININIIIIILNLLITVLSPNFCPDRERAHGNTVFFSLSQRQGSRTMQVIH